MKWIAYESTPKFGIEPKKKYFLVESEEGDAICRLSSHQTKEIAELVASAPDLLAILEEVAKDFDGMVLMRGDLAERIWKTIKKARGQNG